MAENTTFTEHEVENAGVSQFQTGLARAVNDTYYYINNTRFIALMPTYMKEYAWRYVRPCLEWLDGFVRALHYNGDSGILSTKIGKSLITGITKQIVGEKLLIKLNVEVPTQQDYENLKKINVWSTEAKIINALFGGIGYALASGTSMLKANHTVDGKVWWEGVRFDNMFYKTDFRGNVEEASFLIHGYTDTRQGKDNAQYLLCEHRFYEYCKPEIDAKTLEVIHKKGDKVAKVEYCVYRVQGQMGNMDKPVFKNGSIVKWEELPKDIKDNIRNDYSAIRIGEAQNLGFTNLACELLINGGQDLSCPNGRFLGQGLLYEAQNDLVTYEVAASYKIRDMYLGKGTVYQPKSLNMTDIANQQYGFNNSMLEGVGERKVELLKGVDPETQKVIVDQFQVRGEEWQTIMNNSICNIASKWGMSPKVLSSFLVNSTTNLTATQVDSEDDASVSFVYLTRSYFNEAINKLLETCLNYMGIATNVNVKFATPSLVNKDRIIARQKDLLESGLTTIDDAVREIYPDLEEEQIQKKIREVKEKEQQMNDMNNFFSNDNNDFDDEQGMLDNVEKTVGDKLDGTTSPLQ